MTPHISRKRSTLAIATAVAAGALLTAGLTTGASARQDTSNATTAAEAPAAAPMTLSASVRSGLLRDAEARTAATAGKIGLGAKEKLVVKDVVKDRDGTTHTRYERTYDGLPVLGGDLVVHTAKSGAVEGVSKATKASVRVASTDAKLAPKTVAKAAESTAARSGETEKADANAPRKVIWAATGKPVLAFETVVTGVQKDGTPSELHVVTDAASGKKLFQYQAVENGKGHSQYSGDVTVGSTKSGSTYQLTDGGRGKHKTYDLAHGSSGGKLYTDADDVWGTGKPADTQTAAVDAAYGAGLTWDYYKNVHGRSGIKGDGKGATSRVHYGNNYVNAFWQDSCFCMTYGDGEGNAKPLTSIDVAAHEMTHGVTSATGNMEYSGESGGLNEATSDIFAAAVEFRANNAKDKGDYLIGEKIDINGDGSPLRYMDKPSKDGSSLDYWDANAGNVDVHYSSGIANHFFYLLSEGSGKKTVNGVTYDSPTKDGSKVEGIGRDKAEKIWFKALSTYFTSTTNYAQARKDTVKAAGDLYGATSKEAKGVAAAWKGVNVK
ncbi:peptidase M4 family protein [Streptomyces sp. p1417]|uniref:Neutral metalloproteinase n=1 Tax=Streptomyces typhae TaxID=2681492 RepID=A0A6L6X875_9ACTN|nr:peptidase M4 family protein [Streptomyces typhae]